MKISISISHEECLYEAGLKIASLAETYDFAQHTISQDLMQQYWEQCGRDADIMLSRYRITPCRPNLYGHYTAVLRMPRAYDNGLAPALSSLLFSYFTAFVAAEAITYIAPPTSMQHTEKEISLQKVVDSLRTERDTLRQRIITMLNIRRGPVRRRMTFS